MNTNIAQSNVFVVIKTDDPRFNSVNARELHATLEVGKDFSTWIKGRIEQYGFVEGEDFVIGNSVYEGERAVADEVLLANFGEQNGIDMNANNVASEILLPNFGEQDWIYMNANGVANANSSTCAAGVYSEGATRQTQGAWGGSNRVDYIISVDMAKELAMIEANDIGRLVRRYFIAAEKELVKRMRDEYATAIAKKDAEIASMDLRIEGQIKCLGNFMETVDTLRDVIDAPDFKNKAPLDRYVADQLKDTREWFRGYMKKIVGRTMLLRAEIDKFPMPKSKNARWEFNGLLDALNEHPHKPRQFTHDDYI